MTKAVISVVAIVITACLGLPMLLMSAVAGGSSGTCGLAAAPSTNVSEQPANAEQWDTEQLAIAATIIEVGVTKGVGTWGQTIAVAVAMQESRLRNLPHLGNANDHDSIGVFQQRPSQGWGTPEQLADPAYQAGKFYDKLKTVPGWQTMPLTEAAQAVQISAYPEAYAKWTTAAMSIVEQYGTGGIALDCSALAFASAEPAPPATRTALGPKRPAPSTRTPPPATAASPHACSTLSSRPAPPASRSPAASASTTTANTHEVEPATGW
jgi:hypothetical protein